MLTTRQVAERYGVVRKTAERWCEAGLLPGAEKIGVGRRATWLIPEEALVGFEPPAQRKQKQEE